MTTNELDEPAALAWPPAMDPARAAYLRGAVVAIATTLIDDLLTDLSAPRDSSTDSRSERLMAATLRPFLPKMRALFLDKLSDADPAQLERFMGATATTLEQLIAEAPGEPLPRWRWVWQPGAPRPELVEDVWRG